MGQVVRIECSKCESVETRELDGCILVGLREGKLFCWRHDLSWGDVLDLLVKEFIERGKE